MEYFLNSLVATLNSLVEFSKFDESWGCGRNRVVEAHYSSLENEDSANCPDPA